MGSIGLWLESRRRQELFGRGFLGRSLLGSFGPVPLMKNSMRFSASPGCVGAPVFGFTSTCSMPAGTSQSPSQSGCSASATCMKSDQIGKAEFAPSQTELRAIVKTNPHCTNQIRRVTSKPTVA